MTAYTYVYNYYKQGRAAKNKLNQIKSNLFPQTYIASGITIDDQNEQGSEEHLREITDLRL